jgi:hypothetical protein
MSLFDIYPPGSARQPSMIRGLVDLVGLGPSMILPVLDMERCIISAFRAWV